MSAGEIIEDAHAANRLHREKELKPAVNYTICDLCKSRCRELSTKATMWCFDCVEAFCNACIEYHSSMKITNAHYVVDIHKLPENYDAPFLCSKHNRSKFEYFCLSHNIVCCTKCADEKHNMCTNLSIDLYFHKCKNKQMESACKERLEITQELKESYEKKIKVIENDGNKTHGLIPNIDQHKRRDNTRNSDNENETIDDEERLVSTVKKSRRKSISDLNRKITALDIFRKTITEQNNLLKLTLDIGSRKHSFLVIYYLESLFKEFDRSGLNHDKNVNDLLEPCGNRNFITNTPERFVFRDTSIQKSSTSDNVERISANLELEGCFHLNKITEMCISGIAVSVDGLIILCDRGKPQLVVSSETGEKEEHVQLEDQPFEIDVIPKTNFVVITCINYNFILFVNALSRKCINKMEIEGSVNCCIACTNSYILIGGINKIDILRHYGSKVIHYKTLTINYSIISLTFSENDGIIYCSSSGSNKLHRFDMKGNELLPVETKTPGNTTTRPTTCIRVDAKTTIYYLDSDINYVHILSEGKYTGSLVFENPKAFTFNSDCTQLYIVEEDMGCLSISKFNLDRSKTFTNKL